MMKTTSVFPGPRLTRAGLIFIAVIAALTAATPTALAWDAQGHRLITLLALDHLAEGLPAFLRNADVRTHIAENSLEPDRWRSIRQGPLMNLNAPDHYLDVEDLDSFGLTLHDISPLRNEFISQLVLARAKAGDSFAGRPIDSRADIARTNQWPGFAPHAIAENYGKLVSSFKVLRILEKLNDLARAEQVRAERGNVVAIMGIMSHYVGDLAQPLHTTRHHHGWQGDNPEGFTTKGAIHAYIDGTIVEFHALTYDALKSAPQEQRELDAMDPWKAILAHIERSHEQVTPLYRMEKSGDIEKEPGKQLITTRLLDGASMLAALYNAAWKASEPTEKDIETFVKYDGFDRSTAK